jgi:hypothetical protein
MTMYEDGRKTGGFEEDIEIVDVAELIVEALEAKDATAAGTVGSGADTAPADD